ncbi:MAG TPA: AAA family ATPase [Burkholderiales bacterium]|nr:AAA family ATPase [Burkholderiales bacterium]
MALYLEHFGLAEPPFRITPHPDFFFDGADRGATLEGLLYAILHDEGIVKVSGEIGSGKTTLCRVLMERLPAEVETVFLANPSYSRGEILQAIAEELGQPAANDPAAPALRALQARLIDLYASGRRVVVMIDEAHAMPEDTLEQVRLLSNLESSRHKLLQIVLFGQPELDESLAKPTMRQLKDRITHSFRTRPLAPDEVAKYAAFRMRAAGYRGPDVFTSAAIGAIARASSGLTRRINVLCDKALLAAFAANAHAVTPREVRAAIADSDFAPVGRRGARPRALAAAAALLALGAAAGAGLFHWLARSEPALPAIAVPERSQPAAVPAAPPPADASKPEAARAEPPRPPAPPANTPKVDAAPVPLLSVEQLRRLEGYGAGRNPLLRERLAATREKLAAAPDSSYSIELFQTDNSDPDRTERFLLRARELVPLDEVYVIPIASGARSAGPPGTRYRLRITYGVFAGKELAGDAAKRLPPKYQHAFRFELRSLSELRASL